MNAAEHMLAEVRARRSTVRRTPEDLARLLRRFLDHVLASADIETEPRGVQLAEVLAILIVAVEDQQKLLH